MICCGARPVYIAPDRFGWHAVYQLSFTFATRSYHKLNFEPTYFFRYRAFLCGANSREKRASRNSFFCLKNVRFQARKRFPYKL